MASNAEQRVFLTTNRLTEADLAAARIDWPQLQAIREDYLARAEDLNTVAEVVARLLRRNSLTHSVRLRIKDPDHLLKKVIRKRIDDPSRDITVASYLDEITDLVGLRVLHLYKQDWVSIYDHILRTFSTKEQPILYYRAGDVVAGAVEKGCVAKEHNAGYRSVHFVVEQAIGIGKYYAEVQVRTIFEEGWSEVDHEVRYPDSQNIAVINEYLMVFNRLAGTADEMSTYLRRLASAHADSEALIGKLRDDSAKQKRDSEAEIAGLRKKIAALEGQADRAGLLSNVANLERIFGENTGAIRLPFGVSATTLAALEGALPTLRTSESLGLEFRPDGSLEFRSGGSFEPLPDGSFELRPDGALELWKEPGDQKP